MLFGRLAADGRHLGPHVVADEQRADELDVAVDAVRVGERVEQSRAQQAAGEALGRISLGQRTPVIMTGTNVTSNEVT